MDTAKALAVLSATGEEHHVVQGTEQLLRSRAADRRGADDRWKRIGSNTIHRRHRR